MNKSKNTENLKDIHDIVIYYREYMATFFWSGSTISTPYVFFIVENKS